MKKRSMILALASMLGISAAATAVSGFAWFTTQTTATLQAHNYSVAAAEGSLKITAQPAADINCTTSDHESIKNQVQIAPTANTAFADVSSVDGENFYKLSNIDLNAYTANFDKEDTKDTANKKWMSEINKSQMVAVSWTISVQNTGAANTYMDVYLSNKLATDTSKDLFVDTVTHADSIKGTEAKESYSKAYRLAVFDENGLVYFYAKTQHGMKEADGTDKGSYTNYNAKLWDGTGYTDEDHKHAETAVTVNSTRDLTADAKSVTDASSQMLIGALKGKEDAVTLKFVVWCEGTDTPDAELEEAANEVQLSIGLIGLAADAPEAPETNG